VRRTVPYFDRVKLPIWTALRRQGGPPPSRLGNGFGNEIRAAARTGGHSAESGTPPDLPKDNWGIPGGNHVFLLQGGGRGFETLSAHGESAGHGVPVRAVSERLGHATATTTLAIYAHAVPATDRRAALVTGDLLDGPSAEPGP